MKMPTIRKELSIGFDDAMARIPEALKAEGFGVLTQIDVQETLRQKLGVDFRRYVILGACNPSLAHRALQAELDIGVLLPCNIAVYEQDGRAVVNAIDPMQTIAAHSAALQPIAEEVRGRLARALERLA
jgi:uncharacterized protein (DUF302 family)